MKSWKHLKFGHVRLKIRSLGQILGKSCVPSRGQIFNLILMKFGQKVCLNEISDERESESCLSKTRSQGQIIVPMLVTKGL